jgi:hypothetical protein
LGVSLHSIRLGTYRLFKCPNCKEIHTFKITHFGADSSLPTHGDNAETGIGSRIWALMLGPFITLIAIGFLIEFIIGFQSLIPFMTSIPLGIAWLLGYVVYLYRKASRNIGARPDCSREHLTQKL